MTFFVDLAHGERVAHVAVEAVELYHYIQSDDIAFTERVARGETVHHNLVDLHAHGTGEAPVAEAGGTAAIVKDEFLCN